MILSSFVQTQEILSRFVDVERTVNQCVVIPKNPDVSFMEQRINAVVALKHILSLLPPLQYALSRTRSVMLSAMFKVHRLLNCQFPIIASR